MRGHQRKICDPSITQNSYGDILEEARCRVDYERRRPDIDDNSLASEQLEVSWADRDESLVVGDREESAHQSAPAVVADSHPCDVERHTVWTRGVTRTVGK